MVSGKDFNGVDSGDFQIKQQTPWLRVSLATFLALCSIGLNLATILASRTPSMRKTRKGIYLCSMAVAGQLTGFNLLAYTLGILVEQYTDLASCGLCPFYLTIREASLYISLLHMVTLSLERWRAIHYPFRYIRQRSTTKALVSTVAIWLVGFSSQSAVMVYWQIAQSPATQNSVGRTLGCNSSLPASETYPPSLISNYTTESLDQFKGLLPSSPLFNLTEVPHGLSYSNNNELNGSSVSNTLPIYYHAYPGENVRTERQEKDLCHLNISQYQPAQHELGTCRLPYANNIAFTSIASALHYTVIIGIILWLNFSAYIKALSRKNVRIRRSLSSSDSRDQQILLKRLRMDCRRSSRISYEYHRGRGSSSLTSGTSCDEATDPTHRNLNQRLSFTSYTSKHSQLSFDIPEDHCTSNTTELGRKLATLIPCIPFVKEGSLTKQPCRSKSFTEELSVTARTRRASRTATIKRRVSSPARISLKKRSEQTIGPRRPSNAELANNMMERQDRNAACWLAMLTISLLFFWLPHRIVLTLNAAPGLRIPDIISELSEWLCLTAPVLNPLLYGFSNAMFRRAFRQRRVKNIGRVLAKNYTIGLGLGIVIPEQASDVKDITQDKAVGEGRRGRTGL